MVVYNDENYLYIKKGNEDNRNTFHLKHYLIVLTYCIIVDKNDRND